MKLFTESDVSPSGYIYLEARDLALKPLACHERPLYDGYGKVNAPSPYKINFEGKLYRVRFTCTSNVASHWFTVKGRKIHIS